MSESITMESIINFHEGQIVYPNPDYNWYQSKKVWMRYYREGTVEGVGYGQKVILVLWDGNTTPQKVPYEYLRIKEIGAKRPYFNNSIYKYPLK